MGKHCYFPGHALLPDQTASAAGSSSANTTVTATSAASSLISSLTGGSGGKAEARRREEHAVRPEDVVPEVPMATPSVAAADPEMLVKRTVQLRSDKSMCTVGTVFAGSPARKAGLVTGDSIIAFGPLKFEDYKSVDESIVPVVKSCVGKPIDVVVVRTQKATAGKRLVTKQRVALTLTPQEWSGAGLLGCILK